MTAPWMKQWGQLLRNTVDGIEPVDAAPNANLGAVEDGEAAADAVPLNGVPTGVLQIQTGRDG
jgi:hypothetical protein